MLNKTVVLVLTMTLLMQGCGHIFSKCGDNVFLGEFEVSAESIESWIPYRGKEQLVFTNSQQEELVLYQVEDTSFYQVLSGKTLCWEEAWDNSSEYMHNEWIISRYEGEGLELKTEIYITWDRMNNSGELEDLYDHVSFYTLRNNFGGTLDLVASPRDSKINPDTIFWDPYVFADTITINGQLFEDVWYFNRTENDVITPTLFVKKGMGVLGFVDDELTTWLRKME